ncbi:alkaline phosphatase family protein [Myroides sp. LJL119]
MKKLLYSVFIVLGFSSTLIAQSNPVEEQIVVADRKNSPQQVEKPYVIMISIDGFRHDYLQKHDAKFLKEFSKKGVLAESLIPSFPSVTFPNHYTLVTGLYPGNHGLIGNNIYDPEMDSRYSLSNAKAVRNKQWYGGTPIWVLAENQGLLSACYYWPGSEADIKNTLPSYYYQYSEKANIQDRIQAVVDWLNLPQEQRPHYITFYFPDVDHAGHRYGPDAVQTYDAVQYVDKAIADLVSSVSKTGLDVNYVIVSDHGMLEMDQQKVLSFPLKADPEELVLVSNGVLMNVFVKDKNKIELWYEKIKQASDPRYMTVYKNQDIPLEHNYGGSNDKFNRVGDIVITANAPYYFTNKPFAASHGWDPLKVKEMHAIFMGVGPAFHQNKKVESFENVDVYPIVTQILGLEITEPIDGNSDMAKKVLK